MRIKIIFSIALLSFGLNGYSQTLWSWGYNYYGQLGLGNTTQQNSPQQVGTNSNWLKVQSGFNHTIGIKKDGTLWAWGANFQGELGLGNTNHQSTPQQVGTDTNWLTVQAGLYHTIGIRKDGTLWAWGYNNHGQLGLGNTNDYSVPQQIGSDTNWLIVECGTYYTAGIKKDGTLWTWGYNRFGELGLGNTNQQTIPQRVGTDTNWLTVGAGSYQTVGIKKDRTLWAWGYNAYGQLGLGNTNQQSIPQQVGIDTNWLTVQAGYFHTIGIKKDRTLWAWGYNIFGQLGLGNTNQQSTPQQVGIDTNWLTVQAGYYHTIGIKEDGTLWAWGYNSYGQLGLGNTTQQNSPQQVGIDNNWKSVAGQYYQTVALQNILYFWTGTANFTSAANWFSGVAPHSTDSATILSGTMTVNQATTLDVMKVNNGSTVKLTAPLTVRNLHLENGTIDLNGHILTVTGRIYQSTDSTNYYIQAGTSAAPKPRSELAIKPSTAANSTLYFNPNANRLNKLEIGNGTAAAQITLGNSLKIKGGEDGGTGPGLLSIRKNSKIIIPSNCTLTLESDTFNAGLSLADPAKRTIICQGTGKFAIEREHFGARGWRLYAHPFNANIDLQQVADDIDVIGSGGTSEGFLSNALTNASAYWYDYSKADSTAKTDLAWTPFTSAKGNTLSGNPNLWNKNSPILLFNPGARKNTGAFSNPSSATYEEGKITLSYTLDSNAVHLNDGNFQLNGYLSAVPLEDLIGYWNLNNSLKDELNQNDLVSKAGNVLNDTNRFNANESAYYFNSTDLSINHSLQFPQNIKSQFNKLTKGTIGFWVKIKQHAVSNHYFEFDNIFFVKQKHGTYTQSLFGLLGGTRKLRVHLNGALPATIGLVSKTTLNLNQWYHIGFTWDGNYHKLYLNGKLDTQISSNIVLDNVGAPDEMAIGYTAGIGASGSFSTINDFGIWKNCLTSSEISTLYNGTATSKISSNSDYYFLTNPFTTPIKLNRISGLNTTNCYPYFYYWKQRRDTITNNFMPAMWQSELIANNTTVRDTNLAIPAFGTILLKLKNKATTFSIPESAKQLINFNYIIGGAKGTSTQGLMFQEIPIQRQGPGAIEIELLVYDSFLTDRLLIYDKSEESQSFGGSDAPKFKESSFANIFSLTSDGKELSLDVQDITARLYEGEDQVEIPLIITRDANKHQKNLHLRIGEKHSDLQCYVKDAKTEILHPMEWADELPIEYNNDDPVISRYSLVFKRSSSSTEDIQKNTETLTSNKTQLLAYPNPVEGQLHIRLLNHNGKVPYRIYSIEGKKVLDGTIQNLEIINTKQLQVGLYIIEANGEKVKFVKE